MVLLQEVFREMDTNDNGFLDKAEAQAALDKLCIPHDVAHTFLGLFAHAQHISFAEFSEFVSQREADLKDVFEMFDHDKSGYIEAGDMVACFVGLGATISEEDAKKMLAALDQNSDGKISYEEFRRGLLLASPELRHISRAWMAYAGFDLGDENFAIGGLTHGLLEDSQSPASSSSTSSSPTSPLVQAKAQAIAALTKLRDKAKKKSENNSEFMITFKNFFAGGIAGAVSRTAVSPLERLKIMFMCGDAGTRDLGVVGALRKIWREDGMRGYFRGNGANMIRIFPFSAIQLSVYPLYKQVIAEHFPSSISAQGNLGMGSLFMAGVMAGVTATAITYPLDFIRSRLSIQSPTFQEYTGIWDGFSKVVRREGFLRLYTGLTPTIAGIIPYAGIQLSVYDRTKEFLAKRREDGRPSQMDFFVSGAVAGTVAQTVAFPLELVRRRLQTQGFGAHVGAPKGISTSGIVPPPPQYKGFGDALVKIVQTDGFTGLYRGLVPNIAKIVPAAGVSFLVFEQCKVLFGATGKAPGG